MRTQILKTVALAGLMLGAASVSSYALTVTVGGGGGNVAGVSSGSVAGTSTGASVGTTSGPLATTNSNGTTNTARVNLGGTNKSGTIAKATVGKVGGTTNTATISSANGPLVDANADGTNNNDAAVNLGGVMGADLVGLLGGLNGGTGGVNANRIGMAFAGLSDDGQNAVRLQCRGVLDHPTAFSARQVKLCKIIDKIT